MNALGNMGIKFLYATQNVNNRYKLTDLNTFNYSCMKDFRFNLFLSQLLNPKRSTLYKEFCADMQLGHTSCSHQKSQIIVLYESPEMGYVEVLWINLPLSSSTQGLYIAIGLLLRCFFDCLGGARGEIEVVSSRVSSGRFLKI